MCPWIRPTCCIALQGLYGAAQSRTSAWAAPLSVQTWQTSPAGLQVFRHLPHMQHGRCQSAQLPVTPQPGQPRSHHLAHLAGTDAGSACAPLCAGTTEDVRSRTAPQPGQPRCRCRPDRPRLLGCRCPGTPDYRPELCDAGADLTCAARPHLGLGSPAVRDDLADLPCGDVGVHALHVALRDGLSSLKAGLPQLQGPPACTRDTQQRSCKTARHTAFPTHALKGLCP